jgi:hypothetical protein
VVCDTDEVIKGREKRSRRYKSTILEADEPESEPEVVWIIEVLELYRAPVVQIF